MGLVTTPIFLSSPLSAALSVFLSFCFQGFLGDYLVSSHARRKSAEAGDLCVSTPGQRVSSDCLTTNLFYLSFHRFSTTFFNHPLQAGDGDTCIASPSTKLALHGEDISSGRGTDVPAFNTLTLLVHPAAVRCFHGPSSCYLPPNNGFFRCTFQPIVICSQPPTADLHLRKQI